MHGGSSWELPNDLMVFSKGVIDSYLFVVPMFVFFKGKTRCVLSCEIVC